LRIASARRMLAGSLRSFGAGGCSGISKGT
jgi:hypothetical protein